MGGAQVLKVQGLFDDKARGDLGREGMENGDHLVTSSEAKFFSFPTLDKGRRMILGAASFLKWKKKILLALVSMVGVMTLFASTALGQSGKIRVEQAISAAEVEPGGEFDVKITVHGYSEQTREVLPFDAVLIIDQSSSMDETKMYSALAAAQTFIELAENAGQKGSGVTIKIGLVTYGRQGRVISSLMDNYDELLTALANIPSPLSNEQPGVAEGMKRAQELLRASPNALRIAVLFSGGKVVFGQNAPAGDPYERLLEEAQTLGIRYYTVGLGTEPSSELLAMISDNTGGSHYPVTNPNYLDGIYKEIFDDAAHRLIASRVVLRERVNLASFEIIPDSLEFSEGILIPTMTELSRFIQRGEITLPLGQLPSNKSRTFAFRVRTRECLPSENPQDSVLLLPSHSSSGVSFILGQVRGQEPIPEQAVRCFKLSGLFWRKEFDEAKGEVVILLQSTYRPDPSGENIVRDVRIYEYPSFHYQYEIGTANPPVDKLLPGPQTDLLYWKFPRVLPQEKKEIRFKVSLSAYRPRDTNPLRLQAEKNSEGVESWAEFNLPGSGDQKIVLPPKYRFVPNLEELPAGRPDLYITPPLDWEEFFEKVPEEIDLSHLAIPPEGLSALWPFPQEVFPGQQTPDIWIDSEKNGFVTRWEPPMDPQVVTHIQEHLQNALLDPKTGAFRGVRGQGDLFHRSKKNRIYIRFRNTGSADSPPIVKGLKLSAFNYTTNDWEILKVNDLPAVAASASKTVFFELPPEGLKEPLLKPYGSSGKNVWTAILKVSLAPSPNERHTNNNTSPEKIFVAP